MIWCFRIILFLLIIIIAWQDFRSRLIHFILIILFFLVNCVFYLVQWGYLQLFENFLFCTGYFIFNFLVIKLYYILKGRGSETILDQKLGWGDVAVLLSIGICMEPVLLIWFFTVSFILSLLLFYLFVRKGTIPLAGFTILFYLAYLIYISAGGGLKWIGLN